MKEPIMQGKDSAMRHLQSIKDYVAELDDIARAQWWAGFIGASVGCACASIGHNDAQTVLEGIKLVTPHAVTTN